MSNCFICGNRVLGLQGQDVFLDTFYLHDEIMDQHVTDQQAFGDCHAICLADSARGDFWGKRIRENMMLVRHFSLLAETSSITLVRNQAMKESVIIDRSGLVIYVSDRSLKKSRSVVEGWLLPIQHEFNVDLSDQPQLARIISISLATTGQFPLHELIKRLDLDRYLLHPIAVKDGKLYQIPTRSDRKLRQASIIRQSLFVSTQLEYSIYLPQHVWELVSSGL